MCVFSFCWRCVTPFFGRKNLNEISTRFLESRRHNNSAGPWAHLFDKLPNPRHLDGKKWKMWGLRHDKQVSLGFCSRVWQDLFWDADGCHFLLSLLLDIVGLFWRRQFMNLQYGWSSVGPAALSYWTHEFYPPIHWIFSLIHPEKTILLTYNKHILYM